MSPDGLPIYEASTSHPGAYLVTCHSGVTLASLHAGEVARAIAEDALHSRYTAFSPTRFAEAA
jgi:glycine/D-amino acid oxidase-like deaminating enzyme